MTLISSSKDYQIRQTLKRPKEVIENKKHDLMSVYRDTNSTLGGIQAADKLKIPLAQVKSGLRSFNKYILKSSTAFHPIRCDVGRRQPQSKMRLDGGWSRGKSRYWRLLLVTGCWLARSFGVANEGHLNNPVWQGNLLMWQWKLPLKPCHFRIRGRTINYRMAWRLLKPLIS